MNEICSKILEKLIEGGDSDAIWYFKHDTEKFSEDKELFPYLIRGGYFKYFNQDELDLISQSLSFEEILPKEPMKASRLLHDLYEVGIGSAKSKLITIIKGIIFKEKFREIITLLDRKFLEVFTVKEIKNFVNGLDIEKIISSQFSFSFRAKFLMGLVESGLIHLIPHLKEYIREEIPTISFSDFYFIISRNLIQYFDKEERSLLFQKINFAAMITKKGNSIPGRMLSEGGRLLRIFSRKELPDTLRSLEEFLFDVLKERTYDDLVKDLIEHAEWDNNRESIEYIGCLIHLLILNFEKNLSKIVGERCTSPKEILEFFSWIENYHYYIGALKDTVLGNFFENFKKYLTLEFRDKNVSINDLLKYGCIDYFSEHDLVSISLPEHVIGNVFLGEIPTSINPRHNAN